MLFSVFFPGVGVDNTVQIYTTLLQFTGFFNQGMCRIVSYAVVVHGVKMSILRMAWVKSSIFGRSGKSQKRRGTEDFASKKIEKAREAQGHKDSPQTTSKN